MKTLRSIILSGLAASSAATVASPALAQVDIEPPMPNVMIMLDTSGSMMKEIAGGEVGVVDGAAEEATGCAANTGASLNAIRWFALVQALTGTIEPTTLGCNEVARTGAGFTSVFGNGVPDEDYYLPFYQILSNGCGMYPNDTLINATRAWDEYPATPFTIRQPSGTGCGEFAQDPTGVIDVYKRRVRFGLMTFDPLVDAAVGLAGNDIDLTEGHRGTWSYWHQGGTYNWFGESHDPVGVGRGAPPDCDTLADMEVGARGPHAPPWEGRLMGFGHDHAPSRDVVVQNERIEQIITAARPYGATPLSGMMSDLRDLIENEDRSVPGPPGSPAQEIGPRSDTLWQNGSGCRPFHVIVITDGEPNLDLRPDCGNVDPNPAPDNDPGVCPFPPLAVASNGYFRSDRGTTDVARGGVWNDGLVNHLYDTYNIIFHVIGLGVEEGAPGVPCTDDVYNAANGARCTAADRTDAERTCCILNTIQYVGNGEQATKRNADYAQTANQLRTALNDVLAEIATGTATRTVPVYQAVAPTFFVSDTDASAVGHEVTSALETVVGDGMWRGRLDRARYQCDLTPPNPEREFDPALGDDFAANAQVDPGNRTFYTVLPATDLDHPWQTLRPRMSIGDDDGLGVVAATATAGTATAWSGESTIVTSMNLDVSRCDSDTGESVADDCGAAILRWYTGVGSGNAELPDRGSVLGGIFHSQPVIVGPPREFLRDEAYDLFAIANRLRPSVVYTSTVDGQLHAFQMTDNTGTGTETNQVDVSGVNNELWSFVPPIVLPRLQPNLNRHALLLDGGIAVRNMPGERDPGDADELASFTAAAYRTYLVASSGRTQMEGGGYYFALDVTDPHPNTLDFDNPAEPGPKFLWQMARSSPTIPAPINDASGMLFGESLPTAALTTIFYQGNEIPVAILAGGLTGEPGTGTTASLYRESPAGYLAYDGPVTRRPRENIRDWPQTGANPRADRSVTIVRVDTGEVLRRFIGQAGDATGGLDSTRVIQAGFRSPMSGTPVPYPGMAGQVSTRVFIGDADGVLWALNLASGNPDDWEAKIAFDAYYADGALDGAPIETLPVVSVDEQSNPVIVFNTGSQEDFYVRSGQNYVVSISDNPAAASPGYELNWSIDLSTIVGVEPGQRVTGALSLFNGTTYFSTFVPSGDACLLGSSRVWAVDYLENDGSNGPVAVMDFDGSAGNDLFDATDELVFGVTISQVPACRPAAASSADADLFGGYTTFTSVEPTRFELVYLQGRPAPGIAELNDATTPPPSVIDRQAITLTRPRAVTRVDSWAAIVE